MAFQWKVGDRDRKFAEAKQILKRKYSYARLLDDSDIFTAELRVVFQNFQVRYNIQYGTKLRTDGIPDWDVWVAIGVDVGQKIVKDKPWLFTVHGTGQADPLGPGYPADVARQVLDVYQWQPIGNYPAKAFPMGDSVAKGVAELVAQIESKPGRFAMAGYSQGAIVVSIVYKHYLLNGKLKHRLRDLIAVVTWGNPMREKGVANGNVFAGIPIPEGRGIADDLLENTPDWWYDFAHGANSRMGRDIYTDTPDNDTGEMMTAIYRVVQKFTNMFVGTNSLAEQVGEMFKRPVAEVLAVIMAIFYGGQFIITRPFPTMPHINYDLAPAVRFLRSRV